MECSGDFDIPFKLTATVYQGCSLNQDEPSEASVVFKTFECCNRSVWNLMPLAK